MHKVYVTQQTNHVFNTMYKGRHNADVGEDNGICSDTVDMLVSAFGPIIVPPNICTVLS